MSDCAPYCCADGTLRDEQRDKDGGPRLEFE